MQPTDRYSRMVSWLKVVLPLLALALLSTLFLLSRVIDPETVIPFAEKEIQDRLRDQQVTGPFFSGTSADGDQISFTAEKLTTPQGQPGANEAQDVVVVIEMAQGAVFSLRAARTRFDMAQDLAELEGAVALNTSTGYRIESDRLDARMSELNILSPGPVTATGPFGTLDAGSMMLTSKPAGEPAQLIFQNGVKLIYDPKKDTE